MFKRYCLVVIALLTFFITKAQPIINAADYPVGNTISYKYYGDTFLLLPGFSGQYDWDFTNLQHPYEFNLVSNNCDNYCDTFSGSNFFDAMIEENSKNYFVKTENGLTLNGNYNVNANITVCDKFGNSEDLIRFPMQYNDSFTDTFFNTISTYSSGNFISTELEYGNIAGIFDGYGSIKTPTGLYNNVLRLKQNVKIYGDQDTLEYESYQWFQAGIGHAILETKIYPFDFSKSWYRYTTTAPNNVNSVYENSNYKYQINIYPNPTQNLFRIRVIEPKSYTIIVRNMVGNVIFQTIQNSKCLETEISTEGWPNGIYLIEIKEENKASFFQKLVVE